MKSKKYRKFPEEEEVKLVHNFQPRNKKQQELIDLINTKEIVIAKGVPGSGKTFVALATALGLLGKKYKQLILVKSVTVIPGEELGFLKGELAQKMEPYMMSFVWNMNKIVGHSATRTLFDDKIVEILPLAFIRGLSIDNSIVIIDETQNIDYHTFKTIMTRIGENSKYIFLGDVEQIDRKKKQESCLNAVLEIFEDSEIVGTMEFTDEDCVRNPIIPKIMNTLKESHV